MVSDGQGDPSFYLTDFAGRFSFTLGKGEYTFTFFKDSQYEAKTIDVEVKNALPQKFPSIELERLFDLEEEVYYSSDLHQHTIYSDGADTPVDMYLYNAAMGFGFSVLSDHNSVGGVPFSTGLKAVCEYAGLEYANNEGSVCINDYLGGLVNGEYHFWNFMGSSEDHMGSHGTTDSYGTCLAAGSEYLLYYV